MSELANLDCNIEPYRYNTNAQEILNAPNSNALAHPINPIDRNSNSTYLSKMLMPIGVCKCVWERAKACQTADIDAKSVFGNSVVMVIAIEHSTSIHQVQEAFASYSTCIHYTYNSSVLMCSRFDLPSEQFDWIFLFKGKFKHQVQLLNDDYLTVVAIKTQQVRYLC